MGYEIERDWVTVSGLRAICAIVNSSHRCGYVQVPPDNPLYRVDYAEETDCFDEYEEASPDVVFDVHGGLTFSGGDGYPVDSDGWWFGFDCAHAGDGLMEGRSDFIFSGAVHSMEYVVDECESLAQQIADKTAK